MFNKVEALRKKGLAEAMIARKDYASARDELLKAQKLFPALDHIVSMLTVCDVLLAARNAIPGYDTDHYWVLHLMPSSSLSDITCRYQKLASLLQPIKSKFPGSELAIKRIDEAFCVLSDRDKRLNFDFKRGTSWADYESFAKQASFGQSITTKEIHYSAQTPSSGDRSFSGQTLDEASLSKDMHLEGFLNMELKVPANDNSNKQHDFVRFQEPSSLSSNAYSEGTTGEDVDMPLDEINPYPELHHSALKGPSWSSKAVLPKRHDQDFYNFCNDRTGMSFEAGQIWAVNHQLNESQNCRYVLIGNALESSVSYKWLKPVPITEGERRWCDAGLPVACGSFCLDLEMNEKVSQPRVFLYKCAWVPGAMLEQFEIYPKKGEIWAIYDNWDLDEWSYKPQTIKRCKFKIVEFLSDFSKYLGGAGACLEKVDGFRSTFQRQTKEGYPIARHISPGDLYMLSHHVPAYSFIGGEIDGVVRGMFELDQLALADDMVHDMDSQKMPEEENSDSSDLTIFAEQPFSLKPNQESTLLGPNWSLKDFAMGQVWAVYSDKDSMPRQYARINSVISAGQVCVSFLEPRAISNFEVKWRKENLPIVCGVFRASETTVNLELSKLSHPVKCQQSTTRPIYKIYPMKGEVWAMYQNWNSNWKHSDYDNCQCLVVEILSDLSGEESLMIARLKEAEGCLTFFLRQQRDGFDMTRAVSKSEMLSFSHPIQAFRVPGIGQYGISEHSWHLEPNALPPNLGD
ncbi:hypothetical protein RJ640_021481 [Escallonia rubra]|uniref:J domain-containing protein n=1 Tax=Escallonia rubra TaxID=112253 RepID=A0AA88U7W8_9ASTE|nr:hypothetical protein RJ640_021481 [Escallonia rubra]